MPACQAAPPGLCDLARSSDDWQYMAIDCLLLLLDDPETWHAVADATAPCLVDLAELRRLGPRRRLGDAITSALLLNDDDEGHLRVRALGTEAKEAVASLREVKIERKEREEAMSRDELLERKLLAKEKKRQGNGMFWHGEMSVTGLFAGVSAGGGKVGRDDRVGSDDPMPRCSDGDDDGDDEEDDDGDDCDRDGSEEEFYDTELRFCRSG
ncbi:hypothetical protein TRIUR3_13011 [Triticum urartu]|uniref:Uncharacterized protein n=1 Tax=Triticum urartu TaxID=4572 RepID=M8ALJ7_TRIUA|nr:hypothetical protein TRIUR3_13011 [Triticum urartu]